MPTVTEKIEYALMSPGGEICAHNGTTAAARGGTHFPQWSDTPGVAAKLRTEIVESLERMGIHELAPDYAIVKRKTTTVVHDYEITEL